MQAAIAERTAPVAPLVKWAGGKSAMADLILRAMPRTFGTYYEPFAGGASIAFALEAHHGPHPIVLGDVNGDLIHVYREVARDAEAVIRELRRMATKHSAIYYQHVRERWNRQARCTDARRAAAFLYLNRTCFNGLWRVNRSGHFNVPMGDCKPAAICDPDRVRAAAAVLQRVRLQRGPWHETVEYAQAGDVVFFDPPYVPRDLTSNFTAYHAGGFGDDDQRRLAREALAMVRRGVHVILTNHDVPRVRELYASTAWRRKRVMMSRSISRDAGGRGAVAELLIVGRS